jgi:hypothetical protein
MADINAETVLRALGLARKDSSDLIAPVLGTFILGGIIGATAGLLFAPTPGKWRVKGSWDRVDEAKDELVSEFRKATHGELVSARSPAGLSPL